MFVNTISWHARQITIHPLALQKQTAIAVSRASARPLAPVPEIVFYGRRLDGNDGEAFRLSRPFNVS